MAPNLKKPKITDEVRRAKLKTAAVCRAEFNLRTSLDRIDFNLDVIQPALKQVELGAVQGEIPQFIIEES